MMHTPIDLASSRVSIVSALFFSTHTELTIAYRGARTDITQRLAGLRAPTWTAEELDQATQNLCRDHGLPEATQQPQIYDAFMFNSELDMLEVRLLELYDFVDYFVICEGPIPAASHADRSIPTESALRNGTHLLRLINLRIGCYTICWCNWVYRAGCLVSCWRTKVCTRMYIPFYSFRAGPG